jgi:hypothetical protein
MSTLPSLSTRVMSFFWLFFTDRRSAIGPTGGIIDSAVHPTDGVADAGIKNILQPFPVRPGENLEWETGLLLPPATAAEEIRLLWNGDRPGSNR